MNYTAFDTVNECRQCGSYWYWIGGDCKRCGYTEKPMNDDPIEYSWQSTPQLWCAHRRSYDGAPDAHCPIGFGKTKEDAASDLIEMEELASD